MIRRRGMMRRKKNATVSRTSPRNNRRACLCPDGKTYSRECCDGTLEAQGIGSVTGEPTISFQGYRVENCSDSHTHNVHYHGTLTVGSTYYMELDNDHNGCYTILEERGFEGIHITSARLYSDCSTCLSAN